MPIYKPGSIERIEQLDRVLKTHHKPLADADVQIDLLEAYPRTDKLGEPIGPALKSRGYVCYARIGIRGPCDRGQGLGDVLIIIDAHKWPELSAQEQDAIFDHELTHLELQTTKTGDVKRDDYNRPKLNLRLHDRQFGWFDAVAKRHKAHSQEVIQARQFRDEAGQLYLFDPLPRGRLKKAARRSASKRRGGDK